MGWQAVGKPHILALGPGLVAVVRALVGVLALAGVPLLAGGGCGGRPSAPELRDSPVYQNNREGFRFLVPDNWTQHGSSVLPTDQLEGEVLLTRYNMRTAGPGASLEVLCFHESQADDLHAYHGGPSHGAPKWDSLEPPQDIEVNGKAAQRFVYRAKISNQDMLKEVVTFRRGERVYNFIGMFWATDDKAREQLRRAVGSTIWRG